MWFPRDSDRPPLNWHGEAVTECPLSRREAIYRGFADELLVDESSEYVIVVRR